MSRKSVVRLWILFSFSMNILHIYHISNDYLKYDVTTDVQLVVPETIESPRLSACFPLESTVKWNKLSLDDFNALLVASWFPNAKNSTAEDMGQALNNTEQFKKSLEILSHITDIFHLNLMRKFTIQEIFNKTMSFEDVIPFVLQVKKERITKTCSQLSLLTKTLYTGHPSWRQQYEQYLTDETFLMSGFKCFSLLIPHHILNYREVHAAATEGLLQSILIPTKNTMLSVVQIFLTPSNVQLTHGSSPYQHLILTKKATLFRVSYETYDSTLLEYPYKTNCFR